MNRLFKKSLHNLLIVSLSLVLLLTLSINASAATVDDYPGAAESGLTITHEDGGGGGGYDFSRTDTTLTSNANGGSLFGLKYQSVVNITLANTSAYEKTLTFTLTKDANGTVKVNGTAQSETTKTYEIVLAATNGACTIVQTSNDGSKSTITISNITLVGNNNIEITYGEANKNQSGVVTGTCSQTGNTVAYPDKISGLTVSPATGYKFLCWKRSDGYVLGYNSTGFDKPDESCTVYPYFVPATAAEYMVGNTRYYYWEEAFDAAVASGTTTVVVSSNGSLTNDAAFTFTGDHVSKDTNGNLTYTVPAGYTLLVPFNDAHTLYTTKPGNAKDANDAKETYVAPSIYRTLTVKSGANISVNGAVSLSACHGTKMGFNGCLSGPLSQIKMESGSKMTVNNGGKLYAWGLISGSGSVEIKSSGAVYQSFQIMDWRGGNATKGMLENSQKVFPLSQYYFQNIEVPLKINSGANMYCVSSVTIKIVGVQSPTVALVGSDGLFRINSGSVTIDYEESTDRTIFRVDGNLDLSEISISMYIALGASVNILSSDYIMPLNNNITVIVSEDGHLNLTNDFAMYPGSKLIVEEGGTFTVASGKSLYVYDKDNWGNYIGGGNLTFKPVPYSTSIAAKGSAIRTGLSDAVIEIEGTMDCEKGYLYTTNAGAQIIGKEGGQIKVVKGGTTVTYQPTQTGNEITAYNEIGVTPAILTHGDATQLATANSETNPNSYTYTDGRWVCETHTPGDAATCTTAQICTVCQSVVVDALGHTAVSDANPEENPIATATPETCITDGVKYDYWQCTREGCGVYYTLAEDGTQTVVAENDWVIKAPGHTYDEGKETTPATCTTEGVKTFTCTVEGCTAETEGHTKTEPISALGHKYVVAENGYTWADDYSKVTAKGVCENDAAHEATVDSEKAVEGATTPATCKQPGSVVYTAAFAANPEWTNLTQQQTTKELPIDDSAHADSNTDQDHNCDVCGKENVSRHAYDQQVTTDVYKATDATCTAKATYYFSCNCGAKGTETFESGEMLAHSYVETVDEKYLESAATCTSKAVYYKSCSVCGVAHTTDTFESGEPLAHSYVETVDEKYLESAATCTSKAVYYKSCSVCGEAHTTNTFESGETLAHSYVETVDEKYLKTAATCTSKAVYYKSCSVCGEAHTTDTFESGETLAHSYAETVDEKYLKSAATCTSKAVYYKSCSVCGVAHTTDTFESGDKLDHTYGDPEWSWTGSDEAGYTSATATFKCDCGDTQTVTDSQIDVATTPATTEAAGSIVYTAKVTFENNEHTGTKTVTIPQLVVPTGYTVTFDVFTKNLAKGPQITLLDGMTAGDSWNGEGEVTAGDTVDFTVTYSRACTAIIATTDDAGNTTYSKIPASSTADNNTYRFTTECAEDMQIIVAIRGDTTGEGSVNLGDAVAIKRHLLTSDKRMPLDSVYQVIGKVNGTGKLNLGDVIAIKRSLLTDASKRVDISW